MFSHIKAYEDKELTANNVDLVFERYTFGLRVLMWRKEKGLSQQDVAILIGKSRSWVSGLENGKIKNPDSLTLAIICMWADISMDNCFSVFVSSTVADKVNGVQRAL